ncbi:MAG: glycosyltransferase [Dehalococcoidales bacterium]|nr:glycosyltransferase [Dehalococcoidales bacterium]
MEKKVTVIIRNYNQGAFIGKAIDSALNQVLPSHLYEILVIDDGSTDGSPDILETYRNKIGVITQQHKGAIPALNSGIANARGEYIILLDADDTFEPEILSQMFNILERERGVSFVYCDYYEKDIETDEAKVFSLKDNIFNSVAVGIMFRKGILEEAGGYDESLIFPEYDLLIKVMKKYKGKYIPRPLFTRYRHKDSITADTDKVRAGMQQLYDRYGKIKGLRDYR